MTDEHPIKGENREKKLKKKKGQMIVNSAGLKKQTLPLIAKKAKEVKDGNNK